MEERIETKGGSNVFCEFGKSRSNLDRLNPQILNAVQEKIKACERNTGKLNVSASNLHDEVNT